MLDSWWFNVITYLLLFVIFTQAYKIATKSSKSDGALTILLQFLGGVSVLFFIPLFPIQFPSDFKPYLFLGLACIFYAIADRVNTTARRGLEVSIFSILGQLFTVFMIIWGIVFLREPVVLQKILGAALIIVGNIVAIYQKGSKFGWNKYVLFSVLGNLAMSIGGTIDVGISEQFNLPIYVATTLFVPSLLLFIIEKGRLKNVVNEFKNGNKKAILIVGATWGTLLIAMLRAYQIGDVATTAPTFAFSTILTIFVSYFLLKEKKSLPRKILAAAIVIGGIILINI